MVARPEVFGIGAREVTFALLDREIVCLELPDHVIMAYNVGVMEKDDSY